jgi:hypothetical protein
LSSYYIGVTRLILRDPAFKRLLGECGLTVLETFDRPPAEWDLGVPPDPMAHLTHSVYLRVEDPAAAPELEGKYVELTFEQTTSTPDTGDAPTMDVVTHAYKITDRRIS